MVIDVTIRMEELDVYWLESMYGKDWRKRLEQHIANEIHLRRIDKEPLKMRAPWDY